METKSALFLIVAALLNAACDTRARTGAIFPMAPTQATTRVTPVTPATPVAPVTPVAPYVPRPPGISDLTSIAVGEVLHRTIGGSPPECVEFRGWPCQYFTLVAPRSGIAIVELRYEPETQPPGRSGPQGVDISLNDIWAEYGDRNLTLLTVRVTEGIEYTITLWYTFPRLDYELRVTMPD
jgi:hypothetical protein